MTPPLIFLCSVWPRDPIWRHTDSRYREDGRKKRARGHAQQGTPEMASQPCTSANFWPMGRLVATLGCKETGKWSLHSGKSRGHKRRYNYAYLEIPPVDSGTVVSTIWVRKTICPQSRALTCLLCCFLTCSAHRKHLICAH